MLTCSFCYAMIHTILDLLCTHTHKHTCVYTYINTRSYTHPRTNTRLPHTHAYTHAHAHARTGAHARPHTHTYTRTRTRTRTCTCVGCGWRHHLRSRHEQQIHPWAAPSLYETPSHQHLLARLEVLDGCCHGPLATRSKVPSISFSSRDSVARRACLN